MATAQLRPRAAATGVSVRAGLPLPNRRPIGRPAQTPRQAVPLTRADQVGACRSAAGHPVLIGTKNAARAAQFLALLAKTAAEHLNRLPAGGSSGQPATPSAGSEQGPPRTLLDGEQLPGRAQQGQLLRKQACVAEARFELSQAGSATAGCSNGEPRPKPRRSLERGAAELHPSQSAYAAVRVAQAKPTSSDAASRRPTFCRPLSPQASPQGPARAARRSRAGAAANQRRPTRAPRPGQGPDLPAGGGSPGRSRTGGCAITRLLPAPRCLPSANSRAPPPHWPQPTHQQRDAERHLGWTPPDRNPARAPRHTGRLSAKGIPTQSSGCSHNASDGSQHSRAPHSARPAQNAGAGSFCPAHPESRSDCPAKRHNASQSRGGQPQRGQVSAGSRPRARKGVETHQPGCPVMRPWLGAEPLTMIKDRQNQLSPMDRDNTAGHTASARGLGNQLPWCKNVCAV